jgi:hypothetical protein
MLILSKEDLIIEIENIDPEGMRERASTNISFLPF